MSDVLGKARRQGVILRVLPHGTVVVWDTDRERSYPFYKAGTTVFRLLEHVVFETDATDTVVICIDKVGPSGGRLALRDGDAVSTESPRSHRAA